MPEVAVGTIFNAKDKVSKIFGKMSTAAGKFGNKSTQAFNKASKAGSRFGSVTKGILAAGAVQRGLGLLQQGVGGVISEFIQFDDAIMGAGARFEDIGPDSKDFAGQLELIKNKAREMGAVTEFTATQSAQALDFLAKAGFTSAEAMGTLGSMINLATATGEDFARVADISSDLLGAFGLNADNTADKIKNLNRLNDVLVKTTNSANVTVETMFETMKQVGPVATGVLGASLEEVAALTGVLGSSGIKGSEAMTALKNAYLRLAAPVGVGADLLKELNLTLDDGKGGAKKMTDLMAELGVKLKGIGKVKQAQALDAIFGKFAIAGGKNILDNISNIKEFEKTLLSAGGTAQKTADIMRQSLGNRLKTLQSAAIELGFKFLEAFQVKGTNAIDSITKAIRDFDIKPVIESVKTAIGVFSGLYNAIAPFLPLLPILIEGFIVYTAAMKAMMAIGLVVRFVAFVGVLHKAAAAQGILNAVMAANPIGLVVIGIAALITIIVLMVRHWDKVKAVAVQTIDFWGQKLKQFGGWFMELLDNPFFAAISTLFAPFLTIPALIMKKWGPIKSLFSGIGDKFSKVGSFFGLGGKTGTSNEQAQKQPVQAPNQTEINTRQQIGFNGRIQIAGAPEGSTVESKTTGAPSIDMELLGVNL